MEALLERDAELAELRDAISDARSGTGAVVVVAGPAGIGKSALLRVATRDAGTPVLSATAGALETDIPFEVVRSLFARRVGGAAASERAALFDGPARAAAPLLGFGGATDTSEQTFALHGLFWLTQELAATAPLVLAVDDAHWADEPSLRYLAYLARRIEDLPVALLLGVRAGGEYAAARPLLAEIGAGPATRRVRPGPLSPDAARALAGHAAPDLVTAAAGNPFLILSGSGGAEALTAAVDRRLTEIGADARAVSHALALLGGAAQVAAIAEVGGSPPDRVAAALDRLAAAGLVDPGPPLRAAHPLVAEAFLADLGPVERAAAHVKVARALHRLGADDERVASHLLHAPPTADPEAVARLRGAAAAAARAGAPDAAVTFLERALGEPPTSDQLPDVEFELGTVMTRTGRPGGVDHLLASLRDSAPLPRRVAVAVQVAQMTSFVGTDRGRDVVETIIDGLPPDLIAEQAALRAGLLFSDLSWRGRVRPEFEALRDIADRERVTGRLVCMTLALHDTLVGAPASQASRYALDAIGSVEAYEQALEAGMPFSAAFSALDWLGLCTPDIARRLDLAKASTRRRGTVLGLAVVHMTTAMLALSRGRASDAIEEATTALELTDGLGLRMLEIRTRAVVARAHLLRGDVAQARRVLERLGTSVQPSGELALLVEHVRAAVLAAEGDLGRARDVLEALGRSAVASGFSSANDLDWRSPLAQILLALGDTEQARAVAGDALAAARASDAPRPLMRALRAVALTGPAAERSDRLHEALAAIGQADLPLERAQALLALGEHHRRAGERRVGRELLGEALDLADRLGATTVATRAREELLASGARPRRARQWGADALTPSELRVARLAMQGLSNREIAAELFVTPKTVETHLGRCYRKLDVAGRDTLADALA